MPGPQVYPRRPRTEASQLISRCRVCWAAGIAGENCLQAGSGQFGTRTDAAMRLAAVTSPSLATIQFLWGCQLAPRSWPNDVMTIKDGPIVSVTAVPVPLDVQAEPPCTPM